MLQISPIFADFVTREKPRIYGIKPVQYTYNTKVKVKHKSLTVNKNC